MSIQQVMLGLGGRFPVQSAKFNGTVYLARGGALTGQADSSKGTFSCWARLDARDGSEMTFLGSSFGEFTRIIRDTANKFHLLMRDSVGTTLLDISTVNTYLAGATWLHLLSSWDVATAGARHLYITGVSDLSVTTFTSGTISYASSSHGVQWEAGIWNADGTLIFNGCMAEYYFAMGQYIDLSVAANRAKFISGGRPVNLGTDGSAPGLGIPIIYFSLRPGDAASAFATNRGGGGNFTVTASTLSIGSTAP